MTFPSWRDWLFSAKTFAAAMLALYIAFACDLPRPYWAMTTVYVVANPLSGATNSKALYRALGTLLGATAAVVLVPLLASAPELLTLAIALWAGGLCYVALLDRTPRSYVFMLAAYTLPLVALPSVSAPETIFDVAVARSEEIILGIICASVVGATIFPASIGPVFETRVATWLRDAAAWAEDILRERPGPATPLARQRLAADVAALDMFISQLSHGTDTRGTTRWAKELRGRLLLLLPMLSSLADRLHALQFEAKTLPPRLNAVLGETSDWIAGETIAGPDRPGRLRAALAELQPSREELGRWEGLLTTSLLSRLSDIVDLWQDCLALQRQIASQQRKAVAWRPAFSRAQLVPGTRYHDHGLILFACASSVLATLSAGLIWIQSGWPGGAYFVAMTAVACCFFGALDRPAPAMRTMFVWCAISSVGAALYLFAILPQIHDFEMVVLTLAVPFLLIGALIPRPQLVLVTLLLAANSAGNLALQSRYNVDFAGYANEGLAVLGGVLYALTWTLVTKPFGSEIAARRLLRAGWSDLATLAEGGHRHDLSTLAGRNLDRLSQLAPRLATASPEQSAAVDVLREIRVGYNIVMLQRDRRLIAGPARDGIDAVLRDVATFFRRCLDEGDATEAPRHLRMSIDSTFRSVVRHGQGTVELDILQSLVGLRRALFPNEPGPPPEPLNAERQPAPLALLAAE